MPEYYFPSSIKPWWLAATLTTVGENASLSNSNIETQSSSGIQKATYFNYAVTPNIGYFLYDRFVGGLKIGVSHNKENYGDLINEGIPVASGGYSNMTWFDVGPFLRYYFLKTENRVNLFTEGNYIFGTASTKPGKGQRTSYSFFCRASCIFQF